MFKLWFMIKYSKNKKDFKNKLISYLKFMRTYILPTLLMYLFSMCLHPVFTAADHLKLFALYNLIIIFGTHFMLQKFFFTKLEKDVVIKFLPDRIYDYIKVRLIMLLLKWNLPFILTSTLCLRGIFIGSNFIFYLGAILLVTGWFIINYLVALYLRHMKNNIHGIFRIIVNEAFKSY
ncbi:hypothetical protein [Clostridium sp.]|uniref:hypothetical protein n=1 Tax=Clostridium sp. TaxID=1506 RepID=UPI002588E25B|nr:hypothetical protein [Clostridium sp.]MDF2504499.1 hypothetical protein [Clostridium sp.]